MKVDRRPEDPRDVRSPRAATPAAGSERGGDGTDPEDGTAHAEIFPWPRDEAHPLGRRLWLLPPATVEGRSEADEPRTTPRRVGTNGRISTEPRRSPRRRAVESADVPWVNPLARTTW